MHRLKILIVFGFLIFFSSCNICGNPGEGKKIGYIVKLQKVGLFWKTWEGELIRGGLNDGSGAMGQVLHFTIEDEESLKVAHTAIEMNKEVMVFYRIEAISSLNRSEQSNPYFVTQIKILDKE